MKELTIGFLLETNKGSHIDEDLLLVNNIADLPRSNEPGRLDFLFFGMCTSGVGKYSLNTIDYVVLPKDILIVTPGDVTDNYSLSADFKGIGIIMSKNFYREVILNVHELSSLFLFARNHPVCELETDEVNTVANYFSIIKQKLDNKAHLFRVETVKLLLQALVENHFRSERRVGWYAKQLNITPKYLSEAVKAISHRTPNEWIDYYTIHELRIMLKSTAKSIKEIAVELNFPNQSFMGKYFKDHVGVSPSEYRKV